MLCKISHLALICLVASVSTFCALRPSWMTRCAASAVLSVVRLQMRRLCTARIPPTDRKVAWKIRKVTKESHYYGFP